VSRASELGRVWAGQVVWEAQVVGRDWDIHSMSMDIGRTNLQLVQVISWALSVHGALQLINHTEEPRTLLPTAGAALPKSAHVRDTLSCICSRQFGCACSAGTLLCRLSAQCAFASSRKVLPFLMCPRGQLYGEHAKQWQGYIHRPSMPGTMRKHRREQ